MTRHLVVYPFREEVCPRVRGQMWYIRSVQLGRKINITGHRGGIKGTKKREDQRAGVVARILTVRPLSRNRISSALTALIRIKLIGPEIRKACQFFESWSLFCETVLASLSAGMISRA